MPRSTPDMSFYPGYSAFGNPYHNPASHEAVLSTVQHCEAICEYMVTYVTDLPDVRTRMMQLKLLRDCADICTLTAKYIARCSMYAKPLANLCAGICEACANECAKFPDAHSQHCAQVCMNCAQHCRAYAMS